MQVSAVKKVLDEAEPLSDEAIVARVVAGERALFELLMRRANRRVFRMARSIVRSDDEAQDVMQEAYVSAYAHLGQFEGRSSWMTWITRIALHEALARVRRDRRVVSEEESMASGNPSVSTLPSVAASPETRAADREVLRLVEGLVEELPENFRTVFMLREIEGMDTRDVAESLGIPEETVKTRLHRARERMRDALQTHVTGALPEAFTFHLSRCDRVVANVMARLG